MRNALTILSMIILLIPGCFHSNNDSTPSIEERLTDESPAGVYFSFESNFMSDASDQPVLRPVDVLVSNSGEAKFLVFSMSNTSVLLSTQLAGTLNVVGDDLSASLSVYDGGHLQSSTVTLEGTVTEKDTVFGDYVWGDDFGTFRLNHSNVSDEIPMLTKLVGTWTFNQASSSGAIFTFTLTVDPDGSVFGSNTAGCVYNGIFTVPDTLTNIYGLSLEVAELESAPKYLDDDQFRSRGARLYIYELYLNLIVLLCPN